MSADESLALVVAAIRNVAPDARAAGGGPVDGDAPLVGDDAVIDSVGLVGLLVEIEQELEGRVDLAQSFMDSSDAPAQSNPFRSAASLARHIDDLLVNAGA